MRWTPLLTCLAVVSGCAGTAVKPSNPPALTSQELTVVEQGLTDFRLKWTGQVMPTSAATLLRTTWEMVLEGEVVAKGELPFNQAVPAGEAATVTVDQASRYVADAEALTAMSERGGALLSAMRGVLFVKQGETTYEVPWARSRDIRVPRLPSVKLHELDAARYSDKESQATFYLGVFNPNPFPLQLKGLSYKVVIADKEMETGVRGAGEKVAASSTGVFELPLNVNEATYGPNVAALIKSRKLPWVVNGELKGELFNLPYELKGTIELRVTR